MNREQTTRRSGARIMAQLILLLGRLGAVMGLAVILGTAGFLCAMGVTLWGTAGIAKALGEPVPFSYPALAGLAVGCGVARGLLRYGEQYINHYIAFRLLAVLRDKIFGALRRLCPAKLESKQKGAIIAMITADIETLEVFYAHTISPICIAVLVSGGVAAFVWWAAGPWLALTAVAGYLVIGILVPLAASARLKAAGVRYRAAFSDFNAYFLDSIRGIQDIVLHNGGAVRQAEVRRRSGELMEETKRMKHAVTRTAAGTELLVSLFQALSLGVGVLLVAGGQLSAGRMILGVTAVFGSFGPVLAISALPGNLTQTFAAGDRVLNLLAESPAVQPVENGTALETVQTLQVEDLRFGYESGSPILNGASLCARRGEIVGIVGPSGCGKSTMLKLMLRFWQKDGGTIACNGVDVDRIDTGSLLEQITMVSQTTYLFDETIEENLRIAKPDATRQEIEAACRMASIHDFILKLPDGYQTRAGTLGDRLSTGEKQRIGLARAFLRGSSVILLDEPTSNVDSINEGIILQALKEQKRDKCILLVSHRESTMAVADRVYRMEGGVLHEQH